MNALLRKPALGVALLLAALLCLGQALWIDVKAYVAQQLIAHAWEQTVSGRGVTTQGGAVKPWAWADTWPVARLRRPDGQPLYVLNRSSGEALAFGPAHLPSSSLPGQRGTVAIAGHRDTHFAFLQHLSHGDTLALQNAHGDEFYYRVQHIRIADSRHEQVQLQHDYPALQLISCYPFNQPQAGGPLRYVVTALPVRS